MQVLEAAVAANPWPLRRERAAELAERYPHAVEMLRLYLALTVVQEAAYLANPPPPLAGGTQGIYPSPARGGGQGGCLASLAVEDVMPGIIDAHVEVGARMLRTGLSGVTAAARLGA